MPYNPKISVITPAYNAEKYIDEAIKSIHQQNYGNIEIIVIDDGSTDATAAICKSLDVHLIQQENAGISAARNVGLKAATGDLIAFLDADDIWSNDKLKNQLELLQKPQLPSYILGLSIAISKDAVPITETHFVLSLGTALIKKEVFEQIGGFDEKLDFGEDLDWFLRAMEAEFNCAVDSNLVLKFRRHENNTTNNREKTNRFFLKAIRQSLKRRRNTNQVNQSPLNNLIAQLKELDMANNLFSK
ncbi:glycosyltransferase family A protein [Tenacibaculum sp.]|nr:glycosyltransferase family A protein [Tenacibaculum sp.]